MRFDPENDPDERLWDAIGGAFGDNLEHSAKFEEFAKEHGVHQRFATLIGDEVVECSLSEWCKQQFGEWDRRKRVVNQETVGDRYWVSTVFLGLDHGVMDARPLWFEAMIFDNYGRDEQYGYRPKIYCERYSTMDEAKRGHLVAVDHAKKLLANELP
jgi:hypothetical protein